MLDRFNRNSGMPLFAVTLLIAVAVMVLLTVLTLAWSFDLRTSSTWQVVTHHVMLALLFSLTLAMASYRPLRYGKRFPEVMLAVALVVPAVVFAIIWATGGAHLGFRDPRIAQAVTISVSTYAIVWGLAVFPHSLFLLVRDLSRVWRHRQPGESQTP